MAIKVSAAILRRMAACKEQVDVFHTIFGTATVSITETLCVEHANKFNWDWAANNLLPAPLYADYKAKITPLYADYEAKRAPLDADYRAKIAPLYADYKAKIAPLFGRLAEAA
jgi:hypothetical protein